MADSIHIIAISAEIELFKNERILDPIWAKKYPGALWVPILAEKLRRRKFGVTTVDVALSHVKQKYCDAEKIGVIQHNDDPESEELIALGAAPLVLTSFESPLFVAQFYNKLHNIAPKFKNRVIFKGAFDLFKDDSGINYAVRFPSFSNEELIAPIPWEARKFAVMVVNNKYNVNSSFLNLRYPVDCLRWLKRSCVEYLTSKNLVDSKKILKFQLHDKRLSAIYFFGKNNLLDLYGVNWDSLRNLPKSWQHKLKPIIDKLNPSSVNWHNKKELISKYKFALCFENFSYSEYITEKIIDCFAAGVIPVYLGAPDIEEFIPVDSFIDVRQYQSWGSLLDKMKSITDIQAKEMIDSGRKFLATSEGQLHTFEGFASFIESLITQECGCPSPFEMEKSSVIKTT